MKGLSKNKALQRNGGNENVAMKEFFCAEK